MESDSILCPVLIYSFSDCSNRQVRYNESIKKTKEGSK